MKEESLGEETLDPTDWPAFRGLAHRMVDDTLDFLMDLHQQPVWRPMPEAVRTGFREPIPREPLGDEAAYQGFLTRVRPYPNGNLHPRYFGWVQGNGTPLGMMADMLAAGLNAHMAGFNQAPAQVEHQVIAWLSELMGLPEGTSGVLVAGGTMANLLGVAVARHAKAGFDIREEGLQGSGRPRLILYGSTETHGWAQKAVELLGLGNSAYRRIPVDDHFRIDVTELARTIRQDRDAGHQPFCVIGTAGTVNTGATDDLTAMAALAKREKLWFHIDGAFGALLCLSEKLRPIIAGLEQADSIGFDLHKWIYLPFECACVLVRDAKAHREAFATTPAYLAETTRGIIAGGLPFADRGIDLTRNFKALKVWMSFKAHGIDKYARLIEQNVDQAKYLAERVDRAPNLERMAPVPLNVVCFRWTSPGLSDAALDRVNNEVLIRLQERGIAAPSGTTLNGRFALRAAIVNHRTRRADLDLMVEAASTIGDEVAAELRPE